MSLIKNCEHLKIAFEDIKEATQNFTSLIGSGGYGPVYRGKLKLSLTGKHIVVAVKRLQSVHGQGVKEFLTEIQLLSRYKHQNIVSLVGFCEEGNKRFLIYEYAGHGSLDSYLKPNTRCPLTWKQRIVICIDAARGLDHLHNHIEANKRVIHRDIKSGNILLDHNWKAMISDFGFSKIGRANENDSYLITNACGTYGYCDPEYMDTGILTKESDIYSFGVVLFEVLCGRLCFIDVNSKERFLAPLAKRYYKEEKINLIIDQDLKNYMNSDSMKEFSEIAFQCLHDDRDQRPSIALVLHRLEKALKFLEMEQAPELLELEEALDLNKLVETLQMQQFEVKEFQELEDALGLHELVATLQRREFEEALRLHKERELQKLMETLDLEIGESRAHYEVTKAMYEMPDTPISYITKDKVHSHLFKGILLDEGKIWLSIDDDGKTQEMLSAMSILPRDLVYAIVSDPGLRFSKIAKVSLPRNKTRLKIKTQFLSSCVKYAAYLVCKPDFSDSMDSFSQLEILYTLNDSSKTYVSRPIKMEASEWWMIELFQTTTFKRSVDFKVEFTCENIMHKFLVFQGIQFLPIQKIEDEDEIEQSELTNLSTSNKKLENQLPSDYKQFMYYSNIQTTNSPQREVIFPFFPTNEEAFSILSRGLLFNVAHQLNMWFWIRKIDGKKCFLLPPALLSRDENLVRLKRTTSKESRIEYVLHLSPSRVVGLRFEVPPGLLSTNTTYGCYLVYKTPQGYFSTKTITVMMKLDQDPDQERWLSVSVLKYLSIPQIPVVGPDGLFLSLSPMNKFKAVQTLPGKRADGWLEVNIGNKSDIEWMNIQHNGNFDYCWKSERTWKSRFLPCISYNEPGNVLDNREDNVSHNSFTLDPRYFSNITIYICPPSYGSDSSSLLSDDYSTPEIIVQGIEFRPV